MQPTSSRAKTSAPNFVSSIIYIWKTCDFDVYLKKPCIHVEHRYTWRQNTHTQKFKIVSELRSDTESGCEWRLQRWPWGISASGDIFMMESSGIIQWLFSDSWPVEKFHPSRNPEEQQVWGRPFQIYCFSGAGQARGELIQWLEGQVEGKRINWVVLWGRSCQNKTLFIPPNTFQATVGYKKKKHRYSSTLGSLLCFKCS